jgi:hypothetical protein
VKSFLDDAVSRADKGLVKLETVEKGHGRHETRRYWQTEQVSWYADRGQWEGLRSVGLVESVREINGQRSVERRYYLSSLPANIDRFAKAVRGHWSIENQLHLGAGRDLWRRSSPRPYRASRGKSSCHAAFGRQSFAPRQTL